MQTDSHDLATCAAVLQVIANDMGSSAVAENDGVSYAAALNSIAAQLIVHSQQPRPLSA